MAKYEQLEIVGHVGGAYIDLDSPHLSGVKIVVEDGKIRLHLGHLDFWKIYLSMLQEITGDHLAVNLPSHGLMNHQKDLDMLESIMENMIRILEEMEEYTDWNTLLQQMLARRMAKLRGLKSESKTGS